MAAIDLDDAGIVIHNFQENLSELNEKFKEVFPNIDLNPSSVDGHHLALEATTITSVGELLQAVVNNLDENKATGTWLDVLARYKGLTRLDALYAQPILLFTNNGNNDATIPVGAKVTYNGCPFEFSVLEEIEIAAGESESIQVKCDSIGYVRVAVGDWVYLNNTPSNIMVKCVTASSEGRNAETDDELRVRCSEAKNDGLCTLDAMRTYLRNEISPLVEIEENVTDNVVSGIAPHSYRVSVPAGSGSNDEVAQAIWYCKPAGIASSGNVYGIAIDATGLSHKVYFIVPQTMNFYARIRYQKYNEEVFPADGVEQIKANVLAFAEKEYTSGKDIIPFRIACAAGNVVGVGGIRVEVSTDGIYYTNNVIPVENGNIAVLNASNIEILEMN